MKTSITVTTDDLPAQVNTIEKTSDPEQTVRTERLITVPAGQTKTIELTGDVDYRVRVADFQAPNVPASPPAEAPAA